MRPIDPTDPTVPALPAMSRRFQDAWTGMDDPTTATPELLPVRLARACADVLRVDGAGISMFQSDFRVPLGASDDVAARAERLQFTTGQGPCLEAVHTHRAAFASTSDIRARWPEFAAELFTLTPYRAVLSLPVGHGQHDQFGALDLYLSDPARADSVSVTAAIAVTDQILDALTLAAEATPPSDTEWTPDDEPAWLRGPAPRDRAAVWVALGLVMAQLDVTAADALAMLRAFSYSHSRTVDDVSGALKTGTLAVADLHT